MLTELEKELLKACRIALGQMKGSKPLSGCHAGSLAADIRIVEEAICEAVRVSNSLCTPVSGGGGQ